MKNDRSFDELEFIPKHQVVFFENVLDTLSEAVIVVNNKFKLLYYNQAARELHGVGLSICWPHEFPIYLPDKITPCPPHAHPLVRTLRGESPESIHLYIKHTDTTGFDIEVSGKPLNDARGNIIGGFIISTDITQKLILMRILTNLNTYAATT